MQYVSSTPATRLDVINLQEKLDQQLQQRQVRVLCCQTGSVCWESMPGMARTACTHSAFASALKGKPSAGLTPSSMLLEGCLTLSSPAAAAAGT